jgi:hypothetical protein
MAVATSALALLIAQAAPPPAHAASLRPPLFAPPWNEVLLVSTVNFAVEDIIGIAGQEAPIELTLPSAEQLQQAGAETGSFLLIRNVPQAISFSAGMSTGRVWVVPLREADALKLISQPRSVGSFRLEFSLIGPGNRVLAAKDTPVELRSPDVLGQSVATTPEPTAVTPSPDSEATATTALPELEPAPKAVAAPPVLEPKPKIAVAPPAPEPEPKVAVASPEPEPKPKIALASPEPAPRPAPAQPAAKPVGKEEEARLLKRGAQLIKDGALSEARLILKWLADRGSGAGALALARSYDEAFVVSQPALGVRADMKEARRWYERAAELQSAEAKKRLSELPAR